MKTKKKTFGSILRERRLESGYGLREFAGLVGISPSYLSQIEKDQVDPPANEHISVVAELLDVDANELFHHAGRLTDELKDLVTSQPDQIKELILATRRLSARQIKSITDQAKRMKKAQ